MTRDHGSRGYATVRLGPPSSLSGNPDTPLLTSCRGHRINRKRSRPAGTRHGAGSDPGGIYGRPGFWTRGGVYGNPD